jgi:hypothetical protein
MIRDILVHDASPKVEDKFITFIHEDKDGWTASVKLSYPDIRQLLDAITPTINIMFEDK